MSKNSTINYGVIGVGYLGSFHVQQLKEIENVNLVGIFDVDKEKGESVSNTYGIKLFNNLNELCEKCDAVSIVTPTNTHFEVANICLDNNCHIFIEKPITNNLNDAEKIIIKAQGLNTVLQVGHIERFNPVYANINSKDISPLFIESHRLAPFNSRGTDVSVVLDLMIHDIDILLSYVNSDIKNIQASGSSIISNEIDLANARIEFINGCVANLTASRVSENKMRKFRIFQSHSYISMDFLSYKIEKYLLKDEKKKNESYTLLNDQYLKHEEYTVPEYNALNKELTHFIDCIINNNQPITDGKSAMQALRLALDIESMF